MTFKKKQDKAMLPMLTVTAEQKEWLEKKKEETGHSFAGMVRIMIEEKMNEEIENTYSNRKAS